MGYAKFAVQLAKELAVITLAGVAVGAGVEAGTQAMEKMGGRRGRRLTAGQRLSRKHSGLDRDDDNRMHAGCVNNRRMNVVFSAQPVNHADRA